MEALGLRLNPQRDRRTIQRALAHAKCPGRAANGRYFVPAWQKFFDDYGTVGHLDDPGRSTKGEPAGIERKLKEARIRTELADAERRERENRRAMGLLIEKQKATDDVARLFSEVKRRLMRLPSQVAPMIVAKRDKVAAAELLTERLTKILQDLVVENVRVLNTGAEPPDDDADA